MLAGPDVLAQPSVPSQVSQFQELLPEGTERLGLKKEGGCQEFEGEELFVYIDGGAEVYFEYGFKRVIVQEYRGEPADRVSLEIFEMDSAVSAFGMFTFKSGPHGEALAWGDGGRLSDYYLNFWKGPYLVTITALDPGSASKRILLELARLVTRKLPGHGEPPALVSLLPEERRQPQGTLLFKGPIALYNSYPFFREDVFAFKRGVAGRYEKGESLYLFEYADQETAQSRFEEAAARFTAEARYRDVSREGQRLKAHDNRGRWLLTLQTKSYIIIALGAGDSREPEELLARAARRLAADKEER